MKLGIWFAVAATLGLAACNAKQPAETKEAAKSEPAGTNPGDKAPSKSADQPLPEGVPAGCREYAEMIGKLATCDKLGSAREGLEQAYATAKAAWANVPADRKAEVEAQCKSQSEGLRTAASAVCGW